VPARDRAVQVQTRVVPTYEVERMDAPTAQDIPALAAVVADMQVLAETADADFMAALGPLAEAYEAWIVEQEQRLADPAPDLAPYRDSGQLALANCRATLKRIRAGIALLGSSPQAADAFRFANRAMWQQRVRSFYARAVRRDQPAESEQFDIPANRRWYPFQMAFILLNLPALADPADPDRSDPTQALADLLWFPTGGGKTEAYLGVTAFMLAYRRLTASERGGAGVAVVMRYTLRLLTLQQFQRATALICACEVIRRADPARWGEEPFRIGLWVGQASTPNYTEQADEIIRQLKQGGRPGARGTVAQLTNCPWCGQPIRPGTDIVVETIAAGRGRTFQYCSDPLGGCPFSRKQSPDEGLPIVVVDEEIYRRLPALLIATVDKFAQMPWKGETQMLFGRVTGWCPRHGYRSPDLEDSDSHPKRGALPACKTKSMAPLRPPDLIIQDELHLISGPLGTLVGLYETAVDRLCEWQLNGHTIRPKVIASTATIRRSASQVNSLYLRGVAIFPPSALDVEDNFFSRRRVSSEAAPGRHYIGLCAPGTRLRALLIRVYVAYMGAAQTLYTKYGAAADPWMTLIGYFNALRELGGMRRVVDDSVRTRLMRIEERGLARRRIDAVEELTSRKGATDIPRILDRLEAQFDPAAEAERRARPPGAGPRRDYSKEPYDVILATNMISVGVDVPRLGLMVVANQPKATAEYIQATSRVGRSFPGVVVTVYNWARPRDLSHYERFEHYHATFYQQVEALSVTPFSPRALDRGLTALLVSLVRLPDERYNANDQAGRLDRQAAAVTEAVASISRRAGLVTGDPAVEQFVRQALKVRLDGWLAQAQAITGGAVLGYQARRDGKTLALLKQTSDDDWSPFTCLNSLRDVEPNVALIMNDFGMDREPPGVSTPQAAPVNSPADPPAEGA
jgi:hypothetical protein